MPRGRPAPRKPATRAAPDASQRGLPQVGALLESPEMRRAAVLHGRPLIVRLVRERLDRLRRDLRARRLDRRGLEGAVADLPGWVGREAAARTVSSMRPVVNATGVILHTNLGRANLPESALARMAAVGRSYTTLEYDLERGARGSRSSHLDRLGALLFPGKGLHVVNNNAAAVLLALNTLADGREVVVSRGELVEIGGSFRIPDVMRKSGAVLREVGTTNKTRLSDYERALGPKTGLILKVHPSNYRIVGFTAQAALRDVARLGRRRRIPVLMDQGSGNLIDLARHGLTGEPTVGEALRDGADVVCCSGDKLLGGPQAGLIIGRPDLVRRIRENALARALRVDKTTYAALEGVLLEHARGTAEAGLPVLRMLTTTKGEIEARARRLLARIDPGPGGDLSLAIVSGLSLTGGGSAPQEGLPTALLAVSARGLSARAIETALRRHATGVIARIESGRVLLDLRTVAESEEAVIEEALRALATAPGLTR